MIFRRRRLAALVLVVSAACSGSQVREVGCSKDTDCPNPRVCNAGACVDPTPSPSASPSPVNAPSSAPVAGPPPFAMFGGDARHTGRRGGPASAKEPKELWSTDVHGVVAGSPTIGPDGRVYVTSHDGALYAIAPSGHVAGSFKTGD